MTKNAAYNGMSKKRFGYTPFAITLPQYLLEKLDEFNEHAEKSGGVKIGRSFILRFALEELFKRPDALDAVVERKIDMLRSKVLA